MYIFTQPDYKSQIEDFCKLQAKNKKFKDFSWHYHFIISTIYLTPFINNCYETGDFISINGIIGRKLVSQSEFKTIMQNLQDLGILECNNSYTVGERSLGYRFLEYKTSWKKEKITDKRLCGKLEKFILANENFINNKGDGYKTVNYWSKKSKINEYKSLNFIKEKISLELKSFFSSKITNKKDVIVFEEARAFYNTSSDINTIIESLDKYFNPADKAYIVPKCLEILKSYIDYYNAAKISIILFNEHKFAIVDPTGNRFHSNLTNLSRLLRPFLSVNNEKLYQVDIQNSQPTFLGLLLNRRENINAEELSAYLDCCKAGKFYEYIAIKGGFDGDLNDKEIRKNFKQKIFTGVLFDRNRPHFSKWELIFKKSFPTIFDEIRRIKKSNYKSLAIMLQCEESSFIFDCVSKINKTYKNKAPLLTIHDSILSNKTCIYKVREIMEKSFKEKYNFVPKLGIEKL